jgi:hypothetical protein
MRKHLFFWHHAQFERARPGTALNEFGNSKILTFHQLMLLLVHYLLVTLGRVTAHRHILLDFHHFVLREFLTNGLGICRIGHTSLTLKQKDITRYLSSWICVNLLEGFGQSILKVVLEITIVHQP